MAMRPLFLGAGALMLSLSAWGATVTGSASYRERMALPPDAVLEVTLEDVSLADAPALIIGRATIKPTGQVPIAFAVTYDASHIRSTHRYAVRAQLYVDGRLDFTTTRAYPVLTQGAGHAVPDLIMQRVADVSRKPDRELGNTYWKLTRLGVDPVAVAESRPEPHLVLGGGDGRVSGSGGCNAFSGGYTVDRPHLHFGQLASTMMACIDGMEQEQRFLQALGAADSYQIDGDSLVLLDATGKPLAGFLAVDMR